MVTLLIAALLAAGHASGQATPDPEQAVVPVLKQLEAPRHDDYDTAYACASTAIQEMFDRAAFERMVREGYPEIARSSSAHVVDRRVGPDGHVYLRLKIRGANGNDVEAVYDMVWEGGRYRINGVVTKPDPGLA